MINVLLSFFRLNEVLLSGVAHLLHHKLRRNSPGFVL